ncbi:hypothetical protein MRX96_053539 [Rhipicephalus microplus]
MGLMERNMSPPRAPKYRAATHTIVCATDEPKSKSVQPRGAFSVRKCTRTFFFSDPNRSIDKVTSGPGVDCSGNGRHGAQYEALAADSSGAAVEAFSGSSSGAVGHAAVALAACPVSIGIFFRWKRPFAYVTPVASFTPRCIVPAALSLLHPRLQREKKLGVHTGGDLLGIYWSP